MYEIFFHHKKFKFSSFIPWSIKFYGKKNCMCLGKEEKTLSSLIRQLTRAQFESQQFELLRRTWTVNLAKHFSHYFED